MRARTHILAYTHTEMHKCTLGMASSNVNAGRLVALQPGTGQPAQTRVEAARSLRPSEVLHLGWETSARARAPACRDSHDEGSDLLDHLFPVGKVLAFASFQPEALLTLIVLL